MHCQVKAAWHSSCHRLGCFSVRIEVQRLMISLNFRGAILLTRSRSVEEVLGVLVSFYLVLFWLVSLYLVSFWLVSFGLLSFCKVQ